MICNDNIGALCASPCPSVEAFLEVGASSGSAVSVLAVDGGPEGGGGHKSDVTQRAVFCFCGPVSNPFKVSAELVKEQLLFAEGKCEPSFAQIICGYRSLSIMASR